MRRFFLNISTILIFVTVVALGWFCFNMTVSSSAGSSAEVQPPPINSTEAMNISTLDALLKDDNVSLDEAILLPAQTEESKTILVRLKSDALDEYSSQIPENVDVSLIKEKINTGALSRQRYLELSPNLILIAAINEQKQVLWWNLQPDPRIFRAETSDDKGRLSGQTLYRHDVEVLVSIPAEAAIAEVRFYHPVWDGISSYGLKPIGSLNLKQAGRGE